MPYKSEYKKGTVKEEKGSSETLGSQGVPAKIPVSHFKNKPQGDKPFPQ